MASKNLEIQCGRVLARRITFDEFVASTRHEFSRMAHSLLRRWTAPSWLVLEDLVQELYLGAWHTLFGDKPFDPSRGVKLARYVVFNAIHYAKRALHKARGVTLGGVGSADGLASADRRSSNIERPFSDFERTDGERRLELLEVLPDEKPNPEQIVLMAETREDAIERAMKACTCARERVAIIALEQGGDVRGAAQILHDDFDTRIALRLGSERNACRYVKRAARAVAARLEPAS